jgi:hypothetical protein
VKLNRFQLNDLLLNWKSVDLYAGGKLSSISGSSSNSDDYNETYTGYNCVYTPRKPPRAGYDLTCTLATKTGKIHTEQNAGVSFSAYQTNPATMNFAFKPSAACGPRGTITADYNGLLGDGSETKSTTYSGDLYPNSLYQSTSTTTDLNPSVNQWSNNWASIHIEIDVSAINFIKVSDDEFWMHLPLNYGNVINAYCPPLSILVIVSSGNYYVDPGGTFTHLPISLPVKLTFSDASTVTSEISAILSYTSLSGGEDNELTMGELTYSMELINSESTSSDDRGEEGVGYTRTRDIEMTNSLVATRADATSVNISFATGYLT